MRSSPTKKQQGFCPTRVIQVHVTQGITRLDTSRLEKIEAMLAEDPGDTFLRYSRAMELAKLDRTHESISLLDALAAEDPPYVPAFFMAAQQLAQNGQAEEAAVRLRSGIAAAETVGDTHAAAEMSEFLNSLLSA